MAAKLAEGDTIAMQGEVTMVHDDGTGDGLCPHAYGVPITTGGEYLSLVVKRDRARVGRGHGGTPASLPQPVD